MKVGSTLYVAEATYMTVNKIYVLLETDTNFICSNGKKINKYNRSPKNVFLSEAEAWQYNYSFIVKKLLDTERTLKLLNEKLKTCKQKIDNAK